MSDETAAIEAYFDPAWRYVNRLRARAALPETRANDAHDLECVAAGAEAAIRLVRASIGIAGTKGGSACAETDERRSRAIPKPIRR